MKAVSGCARAGFIAIVLVASILPASDRDSPFTARQRGWWAFEKLNRPAVPRDVAEGVRNPVDAFLFDQAAAPPGPADRRVLLRRASFDLVGLPPAPGQLRAFEADRRPGAWSRAVERLLASPHYGETQGRTWLDLVRYAETDGFKADGERPQAWRFRDYVIRAFNEDRPYNRFVQEQLAGDELFPESVEAVIATGFIRMWPDESNASNIELARQDALNDLTANVGGVFLGLSIGCAQCHDHKFDPILQADFYRLQAYFAGIVLAERVPVGSPATLAEFGRRRAAWLERSRPVRDELHVMESTARARAAEVKRLKFPASVLTAIDTAPEYRSAMQHQLAFWSERQLVVDDKKLVAQLNDAQRKRRLELRATLKQFEDDRPVPPGEVAAMATIEMPSGPPPTYLLAGGSYLHPTDPVDPGPPSVLDGVASAAERVASRRPGSSGRRATLATWLCSPDNPLVARVMVNRIWQGHFGRGLVENANDFGRQTPRPRHPGLLDWLAVEFIDGGWSIKHIHRLIMNSAAYRAGNGASDDRQSAMATPRRLSAERIRDAMLAVAGRLNEQMYGRPVRPELPPKFGTRYTWKVSDSVADRRRRSVYIHPKRNLPYPLLQVFDLPDMHESCARRASTTVAPQALMLLNSDLVLGMARSFAGRVRGDVPAGDRDAAIRRAWLLAFARAPDADELDAARRFLERQRSLTEADGETDPLVDLCHVLLNANEFLYVD